jgi:hypothetical protein
MSEQDAEKRVTRALSFLAALYPNFKLTSATIKAYTKILGDLDGALLEAAAADAGSRSTFFPSAAELRRAAFDLVEQAQEAPSAYEAWQQVQSQFRGRCLELHPMARKAIDSLGGLRAFGQSQLEEEPSWRARFIQAYDILAARERRQREHLPEIATYVKQLGDGLSGGEGEPDGESAVGLAIHRAARALTGGK